MKQRIGGLLFALTVGILVAWGAWRWITDPRPAAQRALEEQAVVEARHALRPLLGGGENLHIVDPLQPNRVAGKVFVGPVESGWQVSGHYRHGRTGPWYPWLATLDGEFDAVRIIADGPEGTVEHRMRAGEVP